MTQNREPRRRPHHKYVQLVFEKGTKAVQCSVGFPKMY